MALDEEQQIEDSKKIKKKTNFFVKIILWVFVPLLFITAAVLIVAKFADVNVFDKTKEWASEIPFIGESSSDGMKQDNAILEERVISLQAEVKEKEAEMFQVQQELTTADDEIETLLIEQERLMNEIEVLQRGDEAARQEVSEIVKTFEQMSAKSAAPVLTHMEDAEVIQVLTKLKTDKLAAILEKMSPEDAAKYTSMMTK